MILGIFFCINFKLNNHTEMDKDKGRSYEKIEKYFGAKKATAGLGVAREASGATCHKVRVPEALRKD